MTTRESIALELGVIAALAVVFVATFRVRPAYVDFALAAAAIALIAGSSRRSRELWRSFSYTPALGPAHAWRATGAFTGAALLVLAGAAWALGGRAELGARFGNWHMLLAAPLYFLWALLQQFIFQFYLLSRLLHVLPRAFAIALTALAFASVHFPRFEVMALTLLAGAVWTSIYFRWRSLLPLAVSHALLGAALHYWVLRNDLLARWLGG